MKSRNKKNTTIIVFIRDLNAKECLCLYRKIFNDFN